MSLEINTSKTILGIIGGSGLYSIEDLDNVEVVKVSTPFGSPSSEITIGEIGDTKLAFISRHGVGHTLLPCDVNYHANIYALKSIGAKWCLSISAVGSLKQELAPGDLVVPDQIIDLTKNRKGTFFGNGVVAHVSFAEPFCPVLSRAVYDVVRNLQKDSKDRVHFGSTYVCIEGPAFSTKAESHLYRSWNADIIGMTNMPEAKLAREAEISYATLALVTDYDCWKDKDESVSVESILKVLQSNLSNACTAIPLIAKEVSKLEQPEFISNSLKDAIITNKDYIFKDVLKDLELICGKYLSSDEII